MARIKIKDLPRDRKISKEEMKKIVAGGVTYVPYSPPLAIKKPAIQADADLANMIVVTYG